MLDDLFSFIDARFDDTSYLTIPAELFSDFLDRNGIEQPAGLPEGPHTTLPPEVLLSLLRPDELAKLKKDVAFYVAKYPQE